MEPGDRNFTVDSFTKLPNLFGFIEAEAGAIAGFEGSAILLDMAGLHRINTEYGREVGDSYLIALVRSFKDVVSREGGRAYRLGGDEFLLLLPGVERERAESMLQDISSTFADYSPEASVHARVVHLPDEAATPGALLVNAMLSFGGDQGDMLRSAEVVPFLDRLTTMAGESISLLREAWEAALTDATTGLPNSRAVEQELGRLVSDFHEHGQPFSVLLVDGDRLKSYNEQLGYGEGNRMIGHLGNILSEQVHPAGFVGRWLMGDEFMVLLPDTPRAKAAFTAERIRRAVADASAAWPIPVTVSIGVAGCPENGQCPEELIAAAESANVQAKREGKNRVK